MFVGTFPMNPFSETVLSNCSLVLLWVASSKRLHSNAYLLKARKASKDQEEIITSALQNDCSKIGKIPGKGQCWGPVLKMLSCNFIKTGLHDRYFSSEPPTFLGQTISQNTSERLIWKGVNMFSKPNYYYLGRATIEV